MFIFLPEKSLSLGSSIPATLCDRIYEDCLPPHQCRIQSPNYPGLYPRNRTCNYIIRQTKRVPKGYQARISISQVRCLIFALLFLQSFGLVFHLFVHFGINEDALKSVHKTQTFLPTSSVFFPTLLAFCCSSIFYHLFFFYASSSSSSILIFLLPLRHFLTFLIIYFLVSYILLLHNTTIYLD